MKNYLTRLFLILVILISIGMLSIGQAATRARAAEPQTAETESSVPELAAFHEIIYPIWHTAYPNKDYAALRSYVSQINSLGEKIYAAKLPGILRDKQAKWDAALAELKKSVVSYENAAKGTDDATLLTAAEELHMRYEMMVRSIWPVLKEIDDFHKILYVVYHKYGPDKKYDLIMGVAAELQFKAEAILKAVLPKRLEAKSETFRAAADELYKATEELGALKQSTDERAIDQTIEKVHTKYRSLEKVFD